jgi:alpha-methylacyl-CoA racemase
MAGPLKGLKVIEMAGIGPGPFACMLLSDLGAEVIRVDRPVGGAMSADGAPGDVLQRNRRSIAINVKTPEGVDTLLQLLESADVLTEGYRPGVMEKLGLGPDVVLQRNPRLVYARMTGWGQEGPLAHAAGHDINYIALTGALGAIGRKDSGPVPPLNLVGDFGGGSMYLIMGILSALFERSISGKGQVVDAAITDGVISLMACMQGFQGVGLWEDSGRQSNMLDGGAHYYDTYQCSDGEWVSIGSIEPQFYALLLEKLGLESGEIDFAAQFDKTQWPPMKQKIADIIRTRSRDEWTQLMEGTDVCFAPVLSISEAPAHPHNIARKSFVEIEGFTQAAPAPRFSRTPGEISRLPVGPGADTDEILQEIGFSESTISSLKESGAVI